MTSEKPQHYPQPTEPAGPKHPGPPGRSMPTESQPTRERIALRHAFHIRRAPLPWRKAVGAGISLFIPLFVASLLGRPETGLLCTIGGFASLYVVDEPLRRLGLRLFIVALALAASFALGTVSAGSIWVMASAFALTGAASTYFARSLRLPPPGAFFFLLACAIGTGLPVHPGAVDQRVGFALIGSGVAWVVTMAGRWLAIRRAAPCGSTTRDHQMPAVTALRAGLTWNNGALPAALRVAIGVFAATWIAHGLGSARPYWVPVGCAAVLQGTNVQATVHRAVQRALGTSLGILVAGAILELNPPGVILAVLVLILQTVVELFIVRNYGLAVVFITPLALTIAEAAHIDVSVPVLVSARLLDNWVGCAIGLAAGLLLWRKTMPVR
ncbi:MAG: FUSC family protein [Alicyclobacillus sp.]|nr:FUSC family protein [Alicyclobacillus sp.]